MADRERTNRGFIQHSRLRGGVQKHADENPILQALLVNRSRASRKRIAQKIDYCSAMEKMHRAWTWRGNGLYGTHPVDVHAWLSQRRGRRSWMDGVRPGATTATHEPRTKTQRHAGEPNSDGEPRKQFSVWWVLFKYKKILS